MRDRLDWRHCPRQARPGTIRPGDTGHRREWERRTHRRSRTSRRRGVAEEHGREPLAARCCWGRPVLVEVFTERWVNVFAAVHGTTSRASGRRQHATTRRPGPRSWWRRGSLVPGLRELVTPQDLAPRGGGRPYTVVRVGITRRPCPATPTTDPGLEKSVSSEALSVQSGWHMACSARRLPVWTPPGERATSPPPSGVSASCSGRWVTSGRTRGG